MTEQTFTTELLKWAKVYGWRRFHVRNSGAQGISQVQGDKGFPDLVLVRPPRLIFAELKVGTNKLRMEQADWLHDLDRIAEIETYVWKPEMWSKILVILTKG